MAALSVRTPFTLIQPQNFLLNAIPAGWCAWMYLLSVCAPFPIHQSSVICNDSMSYHFIWMKKENQKKIAITQISVTFIVFHIITFYVGCFHSDWLRILSKLHWSAKCTLGFVRTLNIELISIDHWPFRFQLNGYEHCNFEIYAFTPRAIASGQIPIPFQHTNSFHYDYISLALRKGEGERDRTGETWNKWRPFRTYVRYINR